MDQFEHKPFYTPTEVAAILGASHSYVTDAIRQGRIEAIHLSPRVTRISYATLLALIERPLPIRRTRMTTADIEAVSRSLRREDVPVPDEQLVAR